MFYIQSMYFILDTIKHISILYNVLKKFIQSSIKYDNKNSTMN
jgi:hypothetical protein